MIPRTRRAENHKLFTQEEGKAGQLFRFDVTCRQNDAPVIDEAAFIVAAARYNRQFGRSRRRGLGECTIHLDNTSGINDSDKPKDQSWEDYLLEHFNQAWLHNNLQEPAQPGIKTDIDTVCPPSGTRVQIRLIIRLDEPLLIARRALAGNWFDTRPFIPGSTIRGALAELAAVQNDLTEKETYHNFVALFLRGGVIFPVLYPAYWLQSNIYPTIPPCMGLTTCNIVPFKENRGHGVFNAWESTKCNKCKNERLETIDEFFILKKVDEFSHTYLPKQSSEMHVRIDQESQRASKGDLYGYNVLNAGQYFLGELYCADETSWQQLQKMTGISENNTLTLRLGKARQRGYGKVTARFERLEDMPHAFVQVPLHDRISNFKPSLKEPITLTLLTDTIITNPWGQQVSGLTEDWLEPVLGLGALEITYAHARTRVVDGFNATLGLPRWRDTALTAGSMVQFSLKDSPLGNWQNRMQILEREGIGLRRNEGFGQIAFNHPAYDMCQNITNGAIEIDKHLPPQSFDTSTKFSYYKLWEERLDEQLSVLKSIKKREKVKFNSYFGILARWLYLSTNTPVEELIKQFNLKQNQFILGQTQQALIDAIGAQEYGKRSKDNFYTTEACKEGIEQIHKALESLSELDRSLHKRGIEQIANWIGGLTREKEENS